ncbi:transmembrane protein 192 isoform X2 [Dendrobates tinctorius]|uniref:transmembrane protein 192 isoform X2 n=1 Tax=Dendrobates tinctorius TaxID=92724 RepID=UPI003CCA0A05
MKAKGLQQQQDGAEPQVAAGDYLLLPAAACAQLSPARGPGIGSCAGQAPLPRLSLVKMAEDRTEEGRLPPQSGAGAGREHCSIQSSGELTQSTDIEYLLNAPLLPSHKLYVDTRPKFRPVPTVCVIILLLLIQVAFVALTCVAVFFCVFNGEEERCKSYIAPFNLSTTVVIAKVLLWLLHVVNERFVQYQHCRAKGRGYLKLYWSVRHLKTVPLVALSTVRIYRFNRSMPRPDIIEEEHIHSFKGHILPGIGFRERSSLEDVIEKQGDTIEYLKQHNAALSQKILSLLPQQL